jgi:hypothetical protein
MPMIHEHRNQFDERNLFLQVTLGLISLSRRFDALLLACGPADPPATAAADQRDRFLDLVLGVAAFSRRAMRHIEAAAQSRTPGPRSTRPHASDRRPPTLRRMLA